MVTRQAAPPMGLGAPLLVAASAACVCAAVWVGDPTDAGRPAAGMSNQALLGIDCPGCGSLRMLYCLMHGDLLAAARFNALGSGGGGAAGVGLPGVELWPGSGRRVGGWQHRRWSAAVALVLTVAWFVVRNLPFAPFSALHV